MLILQLAASVFITPKLHRHILVSEVPSAALTEGELWPLSSGVPVPRVLAAHAQQGGVWVSSFLLCVCGHTGVQAHTRKSGS